MVYNLNRAAARGSHYDEYRYLDFVECSGLAMDASCPVPPRVMQHPSKHPSAALGDTSRPFSSQYRPSKRYLIHALQVAGRRVQSMTWGGGRGAATTRQAVG